MRPEKQEGQADTPEMGHHVFMQGKSWVENLIRKKRMGIRAVADCPERHHMRIPVLRDCSEGKSELWQFSGSVTRQEPAAGRPTAGPGRLP